MNRPVQYPLFPTIDTFNGSDSLSGIVVNELEQVLLLFPSEIKIDTSQNENKEKGLQKNKYDDKIPESSQNHRAHETRQDLE